MPRPRTITRPTDPPGSPGYARWLLRNRPDQIDPLRRFPEIETLWVDAGNQHLAVLEEPQRARHYALLRQRRTYLGTEYLAWGAAALLSAAIITFLPSPPLTGGLLGPLTALGLFFLLPYLLARSLQGLLQAWRESRL